MSDTPPPKEPSKAKLVRYQEIFDMQRGNRYGTVSIEELLAIPKHEWNEAFNWRWQQTLQSSDLGGLPNADTP